MDENAGHGEDVLSWVLTGSSASSLTELIWVDTYLTSRPASTSLLSDILHDSSYTLQALTLDFWQDLGEHVHIYVFHRQF